MTKHPDTSDAQNATMEVLNHFRSCSDQHILDSIRDIVTKSGRQGGANDRAQPDGINKG